MPDAMKRLKALTILAVLCPSLATAELRFSKACAPGNKITLTAVGDVLLHDALQIQATQNPDRFISLWRPVVDLLQRTDLTYANFEGVSARGIDRYMKEVPDPGFVFDDLVYSGLPYLNYHNSIIDDLLASGIDVVSTANNHALDRGPIGTERTIEALKAAGLPYTGTRFRNDTRPKWYTVTESKGIRIAWLACGFPNTRAPDKYHLALNCRKQTAEVQKTIRKIIKNREADAVIVTPHWGPQFTHTPSKTQRNLARKFVEAGALAVLGSHPHVIQPWEKIITRDGRETFVIYSLGNFVSGHLPLFRRATLVLNLGLTKTANGKVHINGARYTPLLMTRDKIDDKEHLNVQAIARHPERDSSPEVKEAYQIATGILGEENITSPDEPLKTNPECAE